MSKVKTSMKTLRMENSNMWNMYLLVFLKGYLCCKKFYTNGNGHLIFPKTSPGKHFAKTRQHSNSMYGQMNEIPIEIRYNEKLSIKG